LASALSSQCKQLQIQTQSPSLFLITVATTIQWTDLSLTTQTHSSLLLLCSSTQSFQQTKQTHAITLLKGLLSNNVSISASLILRYATLGNPSTSWLVFQLPVSYSHYAFLWNTLIQPFSIARIHNGFEIYNMMVQNGVEPDDHTFSFVLKVCVDYLEIWKGKKAHGLLFKLDFDLDLFVGNTLLLFYDGCGYLSDAEKEFDKMSERGIML
ncbi:pentatricopeptide repeat-containing protein At3g22690-like, partial [Camellia sinensis]|uniref:pentatricopeptide repeat-containing protein At3g22690-like n=1 Tax=Camellia sinensis TaxID=4442 RepID=UPI0010362407